MSDDLTEIVGLSLTITKIEVKSKSSYDELQLKGLLSKSHSSTLVSLVPFYKASFLREIVISNKAIIQVLIENCREEDVALFLSHEDEAVRTFGEKLQSKF